MKSHVKEAMAKQILTSCMRKIPQEDGTTLLEFSGIVGEIIQDRATKLGASLKHWRLLANGGFSVDYVKGTKSGTVNGLDINDVLFGVAQELDKAETLWKEGAAEELSDIR